MLWKNDFGVWQIDLTVSPHPRVRRSTKTKDRAMAEKIHRKLEAELLSGTWGLPSGKPRLTFREAYMKAWYSHWQGTKSAFKVDQNWNQLIGGKFIDPEFDVTKFRGEQVRDLRIALQATGVSNATVNRKLALVRTLLNLCVEWDVMESAPKIKALRENAGESVDRHYSYTLEEEAAMKAYFTERYPEVADLFVFLLSSGNRLSEALKLTREDYDLSEWKVRFVDTKSGDSLVKPLTDIMHAVLSSRQDLPKPFPWSIDQVEHYWKAFRTHMGRQEDPRFVIHNLRHTCASRLIASGVDLKRVQDWLGHKSYVTTLRYAKLETKHLDSVVDVLNGKPKEFDHSLSLVQGKGVQAVSKVIAVDFTKQRLKQSPGGEIGRHKRLKKD